MTTAEGTNKHILWQTVLGEIELSVSKAAYVTWFKNTKLLELKQDDKAVISVPNIFAKQQFEVKFNDKIKDCLANNGCMVKTVNYHVGEKEDKKPLERNESVQVPSRTTAFKPPTKPTTGLNPRYNFENYIVGSNNDLAYAACQSVAANPGDKYNPLFIYGGVGLGKTHLLQALGNELVKNKPELKVLFINSETFVNEFLGYIRYKNRDFANKYRSVDVLIVDDMQFIAGKEKTQEEFFHTFNALHQDNKQIIISSDKPPKSIPTLTERLRSRFEWGMAIDIQMPDFETRSAIIETKASLSGVDLSRETVEYLASNIKTNIRELEGALNQLLAFAEMRGLEPDLKTAAGLLGNVRASRPHHLTVKQVIDKTSKYFEVDPEKVKSPVRDKHIALTRQIAMYLLRSELHLSFPRIAKELGRKDHTTAIHSVNKIEKAIKLDFMIRENVADIREVLYG